MVRQYVGARYVPKFADPVAWASGTSYEAMTVVTYNNSSYTSKVPVPATVGNPADNPDYWALTGNYNAQVEQYRQETETVSNNLTTLQGQITTEITNLKNADTTLQGQITTEITNRKNADTTLQGQITTEITNRKNADTTLQNNIEAETTARQAANNLLQDNINSEAATRASADSNLQSQINQIVAPSGEAPSAAEVQNARIGADGVTYDTLGTAIRSQVGALKEDLDDVNAIAVNGENVYFYQERPKSNYYTAKVNLKANQTYTIHVDSSKNCSVTIRDKYDHRTEIVSIWGKETKEFTPQTNITELILWINDEQTPTLQRFIVKIYRGKIKDEINKLEKKINDVGERTIYVEKDGTRDFTSLVDAVNYVNSNPSIKFTVYVGSGTYDLIEELGEEYFADYKGVGLVLNNNAHYIFSSNSKVVCNYVGDNENIKKYFSPFNCSVDGDHTGFILENLTLECANVRYAIHDEVNGQIAPYKNEYINCHITLDNSQNTKGYRQCIGGGLGCASEVIIKNCYFKSIGASNTEIVTYHNVNSSSNDNYRSNVTIDSCYFADTNTCRCSYCGISEKISRMIVSNCSLGAEPRMIAETSSALVNFELIKWNNEIRI